MSFFKSFGPRAAVKSALAASVFVASMAASAQSIVVASTTSTEQSGLFTHLLPAFKQATGIDVKVVAVGAETTVNVPSNVASLMVTTTGSPATRPWAALVVMVTTFAARALFVTVAAGPWPGARLPMGAR